MPRRDGLTATSKEIEMMKSVKAFVLMLFAMLVSFSAAAQTPDYTTLTGAVSFTGVITAFLAIGALLMAMYVAWKGIKLVIGMLRGG